MNILAVETGTSLQSIALLREDRVLSHLCQEAKGSHTKILLPAIHEALSSQALKPSDLQGLAVSIGPGSFSGLRVGLATMTGFRMALGIPLVAVPTLEAMAWNLRGAKRPICPILKARSGVVYWACFRWEGERLVQLVPEQFGPLDALVQSLSETMLVFGEGWMLNRESFSKMTGLMKEAPLEAMNASAVNVGLASLSRFKTGNFAEYGVGPHYIQPSYAEMKG
ncbi:MAG: tRNA (adenosine(37)-N6)-threonylcarbamoyltransferase complex dimerization subunit type 1 TsaB [Nitrospirota bacterium]|nr:MAG: tRNA (adenosine(37)-N6)-threonylcarbamoyltransferase complex dimerization subunit type 1 TsaB [Nitrospirota bacterium]